MHTGQSRHIYIYIYIHTILLFLSSMYQVTEGFAMSLVKASGLAQRIPGLELSIKLLPGDSLITRARNTLVALFLGSPQYTHLLFVDTDITFHMDNVLRLLERSEQTPIVAAPYPKKGLMFSHLTTFIRETISRVSKTYHLIIHRSTVFHWSEHLLPPPFCYHYRCAGSTSCVHWRGAARFDDRVCLQSCLREPAGITQGRCVVSVCMAYDGKTEGFFRRSHTISPSLAFNQQERGLKMENGFVQVDNAGTGFLMIRRDVLVTMSEFYSDLQYTNDLAGYSSPITDDNFYGLFDTMIDPR